MSTTNEDDDFKRISAKDFLDVDYAAVTLVDLREPDELIIDSIPGALNIPFSRFATDLDTIPKDKPVYVYCSHGDFSEQVSEILADRGYDVTNVDGGFRAIQAARKDSAGKTGKTETAGKTEKTETAGKTEKTEAAGKTEKTETAGKTETVEKPDKAEAAGKAEKSEAAREAVKKEIKEPGKAEKEKTSVKTVKASQTGKVVEIDAKGLKCPGPIVKVGDTLRAEKDGTRFHVQATEDAFCSDIKVWCERTGNRLDSLETKDGVIDAWLTKTQDTQAAEKAAAAEKAGAEGKAVQIAETPHGKNFVVFDDDLDKVIAAFIMANGAAAMGRPVTMFFTFWGLNVLRKPEKVNVAKTFIEKMFGAMMPRGTRKLPLSHMNMGGAGPKMIRSIMKQHNITSVEDLIQSALDHGVRIIVCQMSMEIMGIKKEELIDGLEYGGVSTFLGNAELSDMSLFI